jgi:hypothetical protein
MNRYLFVRGMFVPALLVTFGIAALLDQEGVLGFERSWPLFFIVAGLIRLLESVALTVWPPPAAAAPVPQTWAAAPAAPVAPWAPPLPAPPPEERS